MLPLMVQARPRELSRGIKARKLQVYIHQLQRRHPSFFFVDRSPGDLAPRKCLSVLSPRSRLDSTFTSVSIPDVGGTAAGQVYPPVRGAKRLNASVVATVSAITLVMPGARVWKSLPPMAQVRDTVQLGLVVVGVGDVLAAVPHRFSKRPCVGGFGRHA